MPKKTLILLLIPLIIAAFTHLYNSTGFYTFQTDEGHYMRKVLVVLNGISLQDKPGIWDAYHAPFFGQILLATLLKLAGYPDFVMSQTTASIELAIAFPRIIMGMLAIIDTFLVYKISERIYNRNVALALFASILFAVTPMTWILRLITLDALALPFLLTSILIALNIDKWKKKINGNVNILLVLLSGTAIGLAILTKLPLITMIPLVGYLIYRNSNKLKFRQTLKTIAIWSIAIFLIPSLWPLYAILTHDFDSWHEQLVQQASRERRQIIETFFSIDSMLFFLGLAGVVYCFARRDWILILWIVPFIIFAYMVGWFLPWHWSIVFPAFCIAAARLVIELVQKIKFDRIKKPQTLLFICTAIIAVGFFNTFMLMERNFESHAVLAIAESLNYLDMADGIDDDKINEKITVIVPTAYAWFYEYVHNLNYTVDTDRDVARDPIETKKTMILQDTPISNKLRNIASSLILDLGTSKEICSLDIDWYKADTTKYKEPTVSFSNDSSKSSSDMIIHNNDNNITENPERIYVKNKTARYININLPQSSDNRIGGGLMNVTVFGKDNNEGACEKLKIEKVISFDGKYSVRFNNFDTIGSYQILVRDLKAISKYKSDIGGLNGFTELFSPNKYTARLLELKANY